MIKLIILFIVFLIQFCSQAYAQNKFQRVIGGTGDADEAWVITQSTDSGYAVIGQTNSFGAGLDDAYIVKFDYSGTLQWSKTIGGTSWDYGHSIIRTTDGGYALAGNTYSFGVGHSDFYIVKLDNSGTVQWSKAIGGAAWDYGQSITQTTDGGYAMAGFTDSFGAGNLDFYIMKLDVSGNLQWSRTIGGTYDERCNSIVQTTDGGYAVAGSTPSFGAGSFDFYIVKFDTSGTLQWSRTVGGTGDERAFSIIRTTDGGFAVAGYAVSFGAGHTDMYIVKLDGSGAVQWSRTVGGVNYDYANSIIQTTDGGYAVAGQTNTFGAGNYDFYIVKLNNSGTLQWSRTVGGAANDYGESVIQTTDGGYAVAGYTGSFGAGGNDCYIVKLDASGNVCGNSTTPTSISGTGGTTISPPSIVNSPPSTVTTSPSLTGTGGTITTVCTVTGIQQISNEIPKDFTLSQNYPNPFNPVTKIKYQIAKSSFVTLKLYNAIGKEVAVLINNEHTAGNYEVEFDGSNYPSGLYFYKIQANGFTEVKKMLLIK